MWTELLVLKVYKSYYFFFSEMIYMDFKLSCILVETEIESLLSDMCNFYICELSCKIQRTKAVLLSTISMGGI